MKLRDYQIQISNKALEIIRLKKIVYIAAEVRTGKTLIALNTAMLYGAKKVLFLTKKKAISSIINDFNTFGYTFNLTVINNESLHTIESNDFDFIIMDEAHRFGSFPKPSKGAKDFKFRFYNKPIMLLSGTPTPESYSQIYHQFWISSYSPFNQYSNFYKWANIFVNKKTKYLGAITCIDYSEAKINMIEPIIKPYMITLTQSEAGFTSSVNEHILKVKMQDKTYNLINKLIKDKVIQGKEEVILADSAVKELSKVHQLFSGTVKFESGNSMVIDESKALFIKEYFNKKKIAIFYKFKEEYVLLKSIFLSNITDNLDEFNTTDKNIALQIVSGREGISLKNAEYLVYFNIDFSATSYWQSRDRLTTMDRLKNNVYWIFAEGGIEEKIYDKVLNKKDYTLNHYKDDRTTISK